MPCRRQRSPCGGGRGTRWPPAAEAGKPGPPHRGGDRENRWPPAAETGRSWKPPAEAGRSWKPLRRPGKPVAPPRRRLGEAGSPRGGYRGEPESLLRRRLREAESLLWRRLGKPEAYCSGGWGNRKLPVVEIGETGSPLRRRQVFARVAKGGRPREYNLLAWQRKGSPGDTKGYSTGICGRAGR